MSTLAAAATAHSGKESFHLGYRPSLDGVRAFAVLSVLVFHARQSWMPGGRVGVDIFFVLSGFLITSLLLEEWHSTGHLRFGRFYLRRALRLLPALFLLLLAMVAFALVWAGPARRVEIFRACGYALFYSSNWVAAFGIAPLGHLSHTWSLSIEEQFYLLWPMLLFLVLRLRARPSRLALLVLGGIVASALWRLHVWQDAYPRRCYCGLDTRADALLMGCLAAVLMSWERFRHAPGVSRVLRVLAPVAVLFLVLSLATALWTFKTLALGGFTLVALASAVVTLWLVHSPSVRGPARILELRPVVWVGKVSYGLYLWHFPVFRITRAYLGPHVPKAWIVPVGFAVSFLVAGLSFHLLEMPFLRLKRKFAVARSGRSSSAEGAPRGAAGATSDAVGECAVHVRN